VIDNRTYYTVDGVYYTDAEEKEGYVVAEAPEDTAEPEVITGEPSAPDPFETLRQMSDYLASLTRFSAVASDSFDEVRESGQKIQVTSRRKIYVHRPNKVAVEYRGDADSRRVVYDGEKITMLDHTKNMYATVQMPDTIEGMLDKLGRDYGMSLPLADMLYPNVYETIVPGTRTGQYIGLHTVGVHQCHHLGFTQEAADWEIWIQTGDKPLPRKLVITYKKLDNLRYTAMMTNWDTSGTFPPHAFEMKLPRDSKQIEAVPLKEAEGEAPAGSAP
jgi:hypothetical protein